jgi:hypothetical protein
MVPSVLTTYTFTVYSVWMKTFAVAMISTEICRFILGLTAIVESLSCHYALITSRSPFSSYFEECTVVVGVDAPAKVLLIAGI